jgi:hypothetical protein
MSPKRGTNKTRPPNAQSGALGMVWGTRLEMLLHPKKTYEKGTWDYTKNHILYMQIMFTFSS